MNRITINGVTLEVSGNNILVRNGKVKVNGVELNIGTLSDNVSIKFEGDLASLEADGSVDVSGFVKGNVDAGGSVNCGNVGGNVDAGGSVNCREVGGSVDAGGSISHK